MFNCPRWRLSVTKGPIKFCLRNGLIKITASRYWSSGLVELFFRFKFRHGIATFKLAE